MRVVGYDPFLSQDAARGLGIELAALDDVLRSADVALAARAAHREHPGLLGERSSR